MFSQSEGDDVWLGRGGISQGHENLYPNRIQDTAWVNTNVNHHLSQKCKYFRKIKTDLTKKMSW